MGLFNALFGTYSERELRKIRAKTNAVLELQDKYARMTEGELRSSTDRFQRQIHDGAVLDDVLPEAFAAVRRGEHARSRHDAFSRSSPRRNHSPPRSNRRDAYRRGENARRNASGLLERA